MSFYIMQLLEYSNDYKYKLMCICLSAANIQEFFIEMTISRITQSVQENVDKRREGTGDWRKLVYEGLQTLCSLPTIVMTY